MDITMSLSRRILFSNISRKFLPMFMMDSWTIYDTETNREIDFFLEYFKKFLLLRYSWKNVRISTGWRHEAPPSQLLNF